MNKVARKSKNKLTIEEFDQRFDDGEDMSAHVDWAKAVHLDAPAQRVEIDFPAEFLSGLQAEALRRGVGTDDLIKMWLADKLDEHRRKVS